MASVHSQQLKTEGNALFGKGQWRAAYDKYSEAIEHDDQNAVLYANRAACALHLKQFVEAKNDAYKATTLDPKYAKAWGRLASACTGLLEYKESAECWRKALATFPSDGLTPAEQKQKQSCELELKTALQRAALTDRERVLVMPPHAKGEMPWDRAKALEAKLQAALPELANSSAWVILRAAKLWDAGVEKMKDAKESITPQGLVYSGSPGVIEKLSDAILTDMRIFRIEDPSWISRYNTQTSFENWKFGGWISLPPQAVREEALKKQQQEGWDAVRPALDITIRSWIMQAFVLNRPTGTGNGNPNVSVLKYDFVTEILDWGRTGPWKDVPTSDKGVIFEDHFVRAVRQLRLDAFGNVVGRPESNGPEDIWKRLYEDAQSLVDEMPVVGAAALPPGDHEPGFITAYGVYPKATALSMIGLYYHHVGWLIGQQRKAGDNTAAENIVRAHFSYINATKIIPPDDEKYAWFLSVAVQLVQMSGAPFESVLGLTAQLRESLPIMKKIWEHSAMAMQGSQIAHSMILRLEERIEKDLAEGKIKRGDFMSADYNPRRSWDVYC